MAKIRMLHQFGMGTSIRSLDYTEACARGIRDALWHNSVNVADALGFPREAMLLDVEIGVQKPEQVDTQALLSIFPYGQVKITLSKGGLDIDKPDGSGTSVIANVAIIVSFDMERTDD